MANTNEVKTFFTIDLSQYVAGLKTMLVLTQQTGVQIKPLLNVEIDKANFEGIDKTFKEYEESVKKAAVATEEIVPAIQQSAAVVEEEEKSVKKSSTAHAERNLTLNKGKREALEMFGATMFLVQGLLTMAASSGEGNKELQKLNRGMSEGISAGFGLAGMLGMLGIASGGTAVAIGAVVTIAVALVRVFGDVEDVTARNKKIQDDFAATMRGTSAAAWDLYIMQLRIASEEAKKNLAAVEEQNKVHGRAGGLLGGLINFMRQKFDADSDLNRATQQSTIAEETYQSALKERASLTKSAAEIEQFTAQARIDSITNANEKEIASARKTYQEEVAMINASQAAGKTKDDALTASREKLHTRIQQIVLQQKQTEIEAAKQIADGYLQADEARFEAQLNRVRNASVAEGNAVEQADIQSINARLNRYRAQATNLAKVVGPLTPEMVQKQAQLEGQITQLEGQEAEKRKAIKEKESSDIGQMMDAEMQGIISRMKLTGVQKGQTEDQINLQVIDRKRMANEAELQLLIQKEQSGAQLSNEEKLRRTNLETEITNLVFQGVQTRNQITEQEAQQRIQTAQMMIQGVTGIAQNLTSAYGDMAQLQQQQTTKTLSEEKKRRDAILQSEKQKKLATAQSAEERDQIEKEFAEKKTALDEEMDGKAKAMNRAAFERWKTLQQITTYVSAVVSAQEAFKALVGIQVVGPVLAVAAAATALAAGIARANLIGAQEVPGLAEGTRITKPTFALLGEGDGPEIVAPEKTFIDVFRTDLGPKIQDVLLPQIKESILAAISVPGTNQGVVLQIHINGDYIGDQEHFERIVKPAVEDAMRRAGTSDAAAIFRNSKL